MTVLVSVIQVEEMVPDKEIGAKLSAGSCHINVIHFNKLMIRVIYCNYK